MTTFTFTDRVSYLAYRANWKSEYLAVSTLIRKLKKQRSETNRAYSKSSGAKERSDFYSTLYALADARRKAIALLIELSEAKVHSSRQRQLAKETVIA